jgi:hypothetical protein
MAALTPPPSVSRVVSERVKRVARPSSNASSDSNSKVPKRSGVLSCRNAEWLKSPPMRSRWRSRKRKESSLLTSVVVSRVRVGSWRSPPKTSVATPRSPPPSSDATRTRPSGTCS